MAETIEKVYCTGDGGSNNLATALLARGKETDPMAMAAMMNGGMGNQWLNNPFLYLIFLAMFGGNGFGFGNRANGLQDAEIQNQIQSLRSQMAENHNSDLLMAAIKGNGDALTTLAANLNCDFNQLQGAVSNVQSAIQQVSGAVGYSAEKVINAANLGDLNIVQQLKDCCCQTQQNIVKMGYESQLGQKDIINAIQNQTLAMQQGQNNITTEILRNLATITAQNQQDKCDILRSNEMCTQRTIDVLNQHWRCRHFGRWPTDARRNNRGGRRTEGLHHPRTAGDRFRWPRGFGHGQSEPYSRGGENG